MAYYVKTVKAGADYDPRQYVYAVYRCDDCGEKTDVTISNLQTFRFVDRPCGACGSVKAGDRAVALTAERNRLQDEVAQRLTRIAEIDAILAPKTLPVDEDTLREAATARATEAG